PEHHGTLDDSSFGVVFWAVIDPGSTGTDQIMGQLLLTSAAGDLATMDVQNYVATGSDGPIVTIALMLRWDASALTTAKLDVLGKLLAGAGMTVYGVGAYEKEPM